MLYNAARASEPGNSESLYLGNRYAEILDFLCAPVTGQANVKVVVSEPGLGKTVLLRSAIERLKAEARPALVFWTQFKPKDFLAHLLFEMGSSEPAPFDICRRRKTSLKRCYDAQRHMGSDSCSQLTRPTSSVPPSLTKFPLSSTATPLIHHKSPSY